MYRKRVWLWLPRRGPGHGGRGRGQCQHNTWCLRQSGVAIWLELLWLSQFYPQHEWYMVYCFVMEMWKQQMTGGGPCYNGLVVGISNIIELNENENSSQYSVNCMKNWNRFESGALFVLSLYTLLRYHFLTCCSRFNRGVDADPSKYPVYPQPECYWNALYATYEYWM